MATNFSWLKERKKQAAQEKLQSQPQVNYSAEPVSSRFNTGYGEDGINQPNKPVMQLQTPAGARMIHEGEQLMQLSDGSVKVSSQEELMNQERGGVSGLRGGGKMPGYQQGGIIPPARQTPAARQTQPTSPAMPAPRAHRPQQDPILGGKPIMPYVGAKAQPKTPQPFTPQITEVGEGVGAEAIPKLPGIPSPEFEKTAVSPLGAQAQKPAGTLGPEAVAEGKPVAPEGEKPIIGTTPTEDKSIYEKALEKAMGELEQIMETGSPAQIAAYQKYIDDLKATQATERMVGAQQGAQGRLGETTAAARNLMMQRMHGINLAGMEAEGGIAQMNAMERATEKLAALGLQGMQHELSQQQFEFAKDQFDYGKQLDTINALIGQGGQENLDQAASMFQDLYGSDIDFSNALQQENIDKFNQGWNQMGSLIASGMSWEEALKVMEKDGTLDLMGMNQSDIEKIYKEQQLQNDPLYAYSKMLDSQVEQGLISQEEADDMLSVFSYALTHPEGFNVEDGWIVKDEAGNEIGFFTNEDEANTFMNENPGSNVSFMQNHVSMTDIGGGDGGGGGGDITPPEGSGRGDVFTQDGRLYMVGEGDAVNEIIDTDFERNMKEGAIFTADGKLYTIDEEGKYRELKEEDMMKDIWSEDATKMLDYESDIYENPYKDKIIEDRLNQVLEGELPDGALLDKHTAAALRGKTPSYDIKWDSLSEKYAGTVRDDSFDLKGKKKHKRYMVEPFEDLNEGDMISIGNSMVKFVKKDRKEYTGKDNTWYYFENMVTGKKYTVKARSDGLQLKK